MSDFDYTSSRWLRLRERALRRDGYRCREAARYGKNVEATTVHHIWPVDQYPQYAWCLWNLLSLSDANHEKMYDRKKKKMTALGLYWQRKVPPLPLS